MHLLLGIILKILTLSKLAPPLRLSEPLPTLCRVRLRALSAQQLHSTAVCNVHRNSSLDLALMLLLFSPRQSHCDYVPELIRLVCWPALELDLTDCRAVLGHT